MIKGALFDFNGTLFYDSDKHVLAFQRFQRDHGLPVMTDAEVAELTFGKTNTDVFAMLFACRTPEKSLDEYALIKEADYRKICLESPETFKLADGVVEMFDWLKERGIPFNIATGSGFENVEFYFEQFGLSKWLDIDTIVYNNNTLKGKPEPDFYIEAAKRIGLKPSECIVFEDALSGFISARAAGAGAIYGLLAPDGTPMLKGDVGLDGEISDFTSYEEIFARHGLK